MAIENTANNTIGNRQYPRIDTVRYMSMPWPGTDIRFTRSQMEMEPTETKP
jgi:hypothetical protein